MSKSKTGSNRPLRKVILILYLFCLIININDLIIKLAEPHQDCRVEEANDSNDSMSTI